MMKRMWMRMRMMTEKTMMMMILRVMMILTGMRMATITATIAQIFVSHFALVACTRLSTTNKVTKISVA